MASLLPEKIYQHIRKKLLAGELQPGARLDYKKIGAELGVSVTPVREAMNKLASEGLIELVPRAGAIVRRITKQEAQDLFGVREAIETYAAARAAQSISPALLNRLDALLREMDSVVAKPPNNPDGTYTGELLADFLQADLAFHMTIIEAADNARLTKLAADSFILASIFGTVKFGHSRELLQQINSQHRQIFDSLQQRDVAKTRDRILKHIQLGLDLAISRLMQSEHASYWRPISEEICESSIPVRDSLPDRQ